MSSVQKWIYLSFLHICLIYCSSFVRPTPLFLRAGLLLNFWLLERSLHTTDWQAKSGINLHNCLWFPPSWDVTMSPCQMSVKRKHVDLHDCHHTGNWRVSWLSVIVFSWSNIVDFISHKSSQSDIAPVWKCVNCGSSSANCGVWNMEWRMWSVEYG